MKILAELRSPSNKQVLFVEMGLTSKQQLEQLVSLLGLADAARIYKWFVIISGSSGYVWKNLGTSAVEIEMVQYLNKFDILFKTLKSQNFTDDEISVYVSEYKVDKATLDSEVAGSDNPLILSYFQNTHNSKDRFFEGFEKLQDFVRRLTHDLIESMKTKVFTATLVECHKWLVHAVQETPIPISEKKNYWKSYAQKENLTSVRDENNKQFSLKLHFPEFYAAFVSELRDQFEDNVDDVCQLSLVQGFMFEKKFLQHRELHSLAIEVRNVQYPRKTFTFSNLSPAIHQQNDALKSLIPDQLYHLRPGHPVIDAVCFATGSNHEQYLLLIQASLSTYADHHSKACDIRKNIVSKEKVVNEAAKTVANVSLSLIHI